MKILLLILTLLCSEAFGAQAMPTPKAECETLMNAAFAFAEKMLKEHGEFFPYGAALKPNGEIVSVAGYDGREHPPSTEIIRLIKQAFVQAAKTGQYKATALVYDVKVTLPSSGQKSDAVAVSLNHRDNYSVIVLIPYQLKKNQLTLGEAFVQKGEADIFPK